jgi:3-oxoacyl-[acyl-carrier protein] reductase
VRRLTKKVAIVTGSSSGIGKAMALRFGEEGASVMVAARRENLCQQVVEQIQSQGGQAGWCHTDITDQGQVQRLMEETLRQFGGIDILVNNAGVGGGRFIEKLAPEDWDRILITNLRGTFLCCQAGFRIMKELKRPGMIINMSSVAGIDAWAGTGAYSSSKFGIMGLTKALADEGRAFGIKVCAICPGGVADDLVDASTQDIEASQKINPYDIAETAIFLASLGPHAIVHNIVVDRLGAEW